MQVVLVKGREFENIQEVHEFLARELDFPDYYGKNLSALYDVLTELCEDTKIIADLSGAQEELLDGMEKMLEVMEDAADYNDCLEVEVW